MNEDKPVAKGDRKERVKQTIVENVGMHPLGATVGAIGGAVAGAVGGMAAGPVGSLVGAVGGAVLGSALGSASSIDAPGVDTEALAAYWRENYASRPYVAAGAGYDDYEPAYRYGSAAYLRDERSRSWDETELSSGWDSAKGESRFGWEEARPAVRDAWEHVHRLRGATATQPR
jgi:hypothetical protein